MRFARVYRLWDGGTATHPQTTPFYPHLAFFLPRRLRLPQLSASICACPQLSDAPRLQVLCFEPGLKLNSTKIKVDNLKFQSAQQSNNVFNVQCSTFNVRGSDAASAVSI